MSFDITKSTGEYLSELYEGIAAEISEKNKLMETPSDLANREKDEATIKMAEEIISLKILSPEITEKYLALEKNISEKKKSLEKIYGIKITSDSLEAVKEAMNRHEADYREMLDAEKEQYSQKIQEMNDELEEKLSQIKQDAENKKSELEAEISRLDDTYKKDSAREKAEYDYNLARERKIRQESRAAEVADRENDLKSREQKLVDEKDRIIGRIAEIDAMKTASDKIPDRIAEAEKEGHETEAKKLGKTYKYERELNQMDQDQRIKVLKLEYDRLSGRNDILRADIAELSKRLEKCNAESRQLTSDTVKSIGGINILNNKTEKE